MYLEELAATPVYGEEGLLAVQAAQGDEQAKQNLACLGLSRVLEIAREFTGFGVLLLDLIQEGSLGLWQAVNRCDGNNYESARDFWIRFYMAKAVTLQARANGVGQKARRGLEDYKQVMSAFWVNWVEIPRWKKSPSSCTWNWKRRSPSGKCWMMPACWPR